MDATFAKLVLSRQKSIAKLEAEVEDLKQKASQLRAPAAQAAVQSVLVVKEARLLKLREELQGFRQAIGEVEPELPLGTPPTVRKAGTGK